MPYYTRNEDVANDFDEYDPTPYGGGYDITVAYGRPLPPSDETCYPHSSDDAVDYDQPYLSSSAAPSAYSDELLQEEYTSYVRPKPPHRLPRPGGPHGGDVFLDATPDPGSGSHGGTSYGDESRSHEHERRDSDDDESNKYGSGDEENHRRKKHGDDDDSEDEEKKHHRHKHRHHKKHDDDD